MGRGTKSSKDEGGDGVWGENAVVGGDSDSEGVDQGGEQERNRQETKRMGVPSGNDTGGRGGLTQGVN